VVANMRRDLGQDLGQDNGGEEIMQDDPLVMPPYEALDLGEVRERRPVLQDLNHFVVEAQEDGMQLADNDVFVVARVANERTGRLTRFGLVARDAAGVRIVVGAGQRIAKQHVDAVGPIEVGLIGGAAPIEAIEVEARRPEIDECLRIVLLLQTARGVKGQIVIDELAQVCVASADTAGRVRNRRPKRPSNILERGLRSAPRTWPWWCAWMATSAWVDTMTSPPLQVRRASQRIFQSYCELIPCTAEAPA